MKQILLSLALILASVAAIGQINNGGGGSGSGSGSAGPSQGTWQIQTTSCGSNLNCTQINGDAQVLTDCTTSNTTATITCPDGVFVSGDVGKSAWAVQPSATAQYAFTAGTLVCGNSVPVPTISTVNSSTSVTLTGSNCTANVAGNAIFTWGHKDGATLHAMTPGCRSIYGPGNVNIIVDDTFLTAVPACATSGLTTATGVPQPSFFGAGGSTNWIISPDFNYAHCTGPGAQSGVCVFSGVSQVWYFTAWGTGPVGSSVTNCANAAGKTFMAHNPAGGAFYFVNLSGICAGTAFTGAELNALDDQWNEGGVQNVGLTGVVVSAKGVNTSSLDNLELGVPGNNAIGLNVLASGQLNDYGTFVTACAVIAGKMTSRNSHFTDGGGASAPCQDAINISNGGFHYSDGDFINQDAQANALRTVGLLLNAGAKATIRNATISGPTSAISDSGMLVSHGGNIITSGPLQAAFGNISGDDILTGGCTGVGTASSTLGVFGQLGQGTVATCTSTVVTVGTVMSRTGTLIDLTVISSAAGTNASSGVVTILKNGVATALTCTIGTSTSCNDLTHTVAYVGGDIISAQFTTQAADTLAGIKLSVAAW